MWWTFFGVRSVVDSSKCRFFIGSRMLRSWSALNKVSSDIQGNHCKSHYKLINAKYGNNKNMWNHMWNHLVDFTGENYT
jgi:hypothetical protein